MKKLFAAIIIVMSLNFLQSCTPEALSDTTVENATNGQKEDMKKGD